jgi:hypothetical protein
MSNYVSLETEKSMQGAREAKNADPGAEQRARMAAVLTGTGAKLAAHTKAAIANQGEGVGFFDTNHPEFADVAIPWRQMLKPDKSNYDELAAQIAGAIASPIATEMTKGGFSQEDIIDYLGKLPAEILGPKPEEDGWMTGIYNTFFGE